METLKEIINVITRNKVKNIEIIGNSLSKPSKLSEFYSGIQSGRFSSDLEASNYFYGSNPEQTPSYRKLKRRLQKRLVNTLFFIDTNQPSFNEQQRAYYTGYKDWAAVKILLGRLARRAAIPLAERIIKNAIKFEFSDLVLDVARTLRTHYATYENDQKKYDLYNGYVKKYNEILNAELIAEEYYQKINSNYKAGKSNLLEIERLAIQYTKELRYFSTYLHSYRLSLYSYLVFVLRYQLINDYRKMVIECNKAVIFFESKKHQPSKLTIINFLYKILACYVQLKEFEKGEKIAQKCLSILQAGATDWFLTLEQYLLLSLHTNNPVQAYEIFCTAVENKNFNNLYDRETENWRTYEAYIHYFFSIGAIKLPTKGNPKIKKFRLLRFLNDMPVHSRDKRRSNIPILIIHVLFLLQKKEYEKVIDRVESLNLYCYRYLRKDDTFRSNCFIKMLLQLPKANFHREAVIRKTEKYYNKLLENPSNLSMQASEIEIMPYEMLWEYVLDSLDNKIRSKR